MAAGAAGVWPVFVALRRLIIPMALARPDAPMEDDPEADEQAADQGLEPIDDEGRAGGPFGEEPARGGNGVDAESGEDGANVHGWKLRN